MTTVRDDTVEPEELPADPLAFRRVWGKIRGSQAASSLVLKAYGVLYDAGRPLTREELVDGLVGRLEAYDEWYLQAWDSRHLGLIDRREATKHNRSTRVDIAKSTRVKATLRWVSKIFDHRRYRQTLIRDKDGRYRPGARAPRMQTNAGMVPFTPETRTTQEIADRTASQEHAMRMEWDRVAAVLAPSVTGESRLLVLNFLARRYAGLTKTGGRRPRPMSDTQLRSICNHLLRADRPAVRHVILQCVLDWCADAS